MVISYPVRVVFQVGQSKGSHLQPHALAQWVIHFPEVLALPPTDHFVPVQELVEAAQNMQIYKKKYYDKLAKY